MDLSAVGLMDWQRQEAMTRTQCGEEGWARGSASRLDQWLFIARKWRREEAKTLPMFTLPCRETTSRREWGWRAALSLPELLPADWNHQTWAITPGKESWVIFWLAEKRDGGPLTLRIEGRMVSAVIQLARRNQALSKKHYPGPHNEAGLWTACVSCELLRLILGGGGKQKWSRLDRRKDSETRIQIQIHKDTKKAKEIKKVTTEAGGSLSLLFTAITEYYRLDDFERT